MNLSGRMNQRHRTRKDLLLAGARLLKRGQRPTMAELAEEARVSRATAYRYFANIDAVLCEAPLDDAIPEADAIFAAVPTLSPEDRVVQAEMALHEMVYRNLSQLRAMLAYTLKQSLDSGDQTIPIRQNRRSAMIEAALAPAREQFDPATYEKLCAALALIFGTESMIVFSDVLQMDEAAAREVKDWAMRLLVRGALSYSSQ